MPYKSNWIFEIQFAVIVSHGAKCPTSDLFFPVMENRSQMIFWGKAFSPGVLKGLESVSSCMEGVFTQGTKRKLTTRTPRLRLLPGGVFLPPELLTVRWGWWTVWCRVKNGWYLAVNPVNQVSSDLPVLLWRTSAGLQNFFPHCKLYPLNVYLYTYHAAQSSEERKEKEERGKINLDVDYWPLVTCWALHRSIIPISMNYFIQIFIVLGSSWNSVVNKTTVILLSWN